MAAPGTSPARWQLPDDLIAAVEAIAKARKQKPATIVAEALTAFINPLPVIEKAALVAAEGQSKMEAISVLADFVDRGFAALAENEELRGEIEMQNAAPLYSPEIEEDNGDAEPQRLGWKR